MSVSHAAPPDNQFDPKDCCPSWCDHAGDCRWSMDNGEMGADFRVHEHVLSDAVKVEQWQREDENGHRESDPVVVDHYREDRDGGLTAAHAAQDGIALLLAASVIGVKPEDISEFITEIPSLVELLQRVHMDATGAGR